MVFNQKDYMKEYYQKNEEEIKEIHKKKSPMANYSREFIKRRQILENE